MQRCHVLPMSSYRWLISLLDVIAHTLKLTLSKYCTFITTILLSKRFISCGFNDSSLLLPVALFTVSASFVVLKGLGLGLHSWIFSLFLERCGTLACFPNPVGVLRDAQGEPGETGEPSGGAARFHSVNTLLDINDGIVWSHNEPQVELLSNVFGNSCPCRCKQIEIGALKLWPTCPFF